MNQKIHFLKCLKLRSFRGAPVNQCVLVRISLGELSLLPRTNATRQLPGNAESSSSRRFAFSAIPASISVNLAVCTALSSSTERFWGPRGTFKVPLAPRDFGPKLSESPVTGPLGVNSPVPLGPREGRSALADAAYGHLLGVLITRFPCNNRRLLPQAAMLAARTEASSTRRGRIRLARR